jgi:hypothetical protein
MPVVSYALIFSTRERSRYTTPRPRRRNSHMDLEAILFFVVLVLVSADVVLSIHYRITGKAQGYRYLIVGYGIYLYFKRRNKKT